MDAVADAFVTTAERLDQLRDPDRLRPWLYAVVRRECLRRLKQRTRTTYDGDDDLLDLPDQAASPETMAEQKALQALVWDAAAGLNERDRAMLDLHLRQGLDGAGARRGDGHERRQRLRRAEPAPRPDRALDRRPPRRARLRAHVRRPRRRPRRLGRRVHAAGPQAGRPARRQVRRLHRGAAPSWPARPRCSPASRRSPLRRCCATGCSRTRASSRRCRPAPAAVGAVAAEACRPPVRVEPRRPRRRAASPCSAPSRRSWSTLVGVGLWQQTTDDDPTELVADTPTSLTPTDDRRRRRRQRAADAEPHAVGHRRRRRDAERAVARGLGHARAGRPPRPRPRRPPSRRTETARPSRPTEAPTDEPRSRPPRTGPSRREPDARSTSARPGRARSRCGTPAARAVSFTVSPQDGWLSVTPASGTPQAGPEPSGDGRRRAGGPARGHVDRAACR